MLRRATRAALVVGATALAIALGGGSGAASPAAPSAATARSAVAGTCQDSTGVTVLVDFSHFGHGLQAGCAHQPSDGFAALARAGFQVTQPTRTPGFVCRIDGLPTTDPCVNTPPTDAYWSYWYSTDHRTWTYTSVGAGGRTPPPGSIDAWSFSTGSSASPPSISPASLTPPAPSTTAAPRTTLAPRPTDPPTSGGHASAPEATTTTAGHSSSSVPQTSTSGPSSSSSTSALTSAAMAAPPDVKARASVELASKDGSGSPWGVIGGAGGAAALAAGAGVIGYRRRRRAGLEELAEADED